MKQCGYVNNRSEWWHYTLANEPYPGTYFDFPVE
jgi:D-alanyl-D-alanine dipeptidase